MLAQKLNIKKDDTVKVIAGKEIGKTGKVLKVITKKNRIIIEKVNIIKRHAKPGSQNKQGGIIEKEGSIHITNVMLVCNKCNLPIRVKKKVLEDGKKVRICQKCRDILDK